MTAFLSRFTTGPVLRTSVVAHGQRQFATADHLGPVKLSFDKYDVRPAGSSATTSDSRPPVFILHGLFGSRQNWRSISKRLNQDVKPFRTIYSIDARNHGLSPHNVNHTYDLMAQDLAAFYKHLGISKAALMGHSMGGRTMMYFALKYPELVDRLIVVDISPYNRVSKIDQKMTMLETLRSHVLNASLSLSDGRRQIDEALKAVMPDKATRDFVLLNLAKNAEQQFEWRININALKANFETNISQFPQKVLTSKFTGPTLFVAGQNSTYLEPKDVAKVKVVFPRAQFEFVDRAGHLVHIDQPNRFLELVTGFLNE